MRQQTRCCEHNPCPGRPEWFLKRFATRPWICPQCNAWWTSAPHEFVEGVREWQLQKPGNRWTPVKPRPRPTIAEIEASDDD